MSVSGGIACFSFHQKIENCFWMRIRADKKCTTPELRDAKINEIRLIFAMVVSILIHSSMFYFMKNFQPSVPQALAETKRMTLSFSSPNLGAALVAKLSKQAAHTIVKTDKKRTTHSLKTKYTEQKKTMKKLIQKTIPKPIVSKNQDKSVLVKQSLPFPVKSPDSALSSRLMQAKSDIVETQVNKTIIKLNESQELKLASTQQSTHIIINPRFRNPPSAPVYPRQSIRRNQEGTTTIRAKISRFGKVKKIIIHKSSSYDSLDQAAVTAVRKWQFEPTIRNGFTTESWVQVPVNFVLK